MDLWTVIADLCSDQPTRTPGWLLTLIQHLPDTSALAAELLGGPEHRGWGIDRHMAASLVDAAHAQVYVAARAAGSKKARPPKPWPRPRRRGQTPAGLVPLSRMVGRLRTQQDGR